MKFSDGEKLILVMLAEIYKHHKIKGEIDPELVLTSIFSDKTWGLKWEYDGIFSDSEAQIPPVVKETCDILDMYRAITPAFDKLPKTEKDRIEKEAYPFSDYVRYQGFDGNNDPHLGVVRYLVKSLDRYGEIKHPDLNSHSRGTLPHYQEMLAKFRKIPDPFSNPLTADQIIEIIKR